MYFTELSVIKKNKNQNNKKPTSSLPAITNEGNSELKLTSEKDLDITEIDHYDIHFLQL